MGYKRDMDRAFKQLPGSLDSWLLTGITWRNWFYFDKTVLMGCRSAPYVCKRTTNIICHIMINLNYFVANYVENFMELDTIDRVWDSY